MQFNIAAFVALAYLAVSGVMAVPGSSLADKSEYDNWTTILLASKMASLTPSLHSLYHSFLWISRRGNLVDSNACPLL